MQSDEPLYSITPGIAYEPNISHSVHKGKQSCTVNVVNSYAAASEAVFVIFDSTVSYDQHVLAAASSLLTNKLIFQPRGTQLGTLLHLRGLTTVYRGNDYIAHLQPSVRQIHYHHRLIWSLVLVIELCISLASPSRDPSGIRSPIIQ
jgi:hypothetical protein